MLQVYKQSYISEVSVTAFTLRLHSSRFADISIMMTAGSECGPCTSDIPMSEVIACVYFSFWLFLLCEVSSNNSNGESAQIVHIEQLPCSHCG